MSSQLKQLRSKIKAAANPAKAKILQRFFKTGVGEYAEGDIFLGLTVPVARKLAQPYHALTESDLDRLIRSPRHEERLIALFILVAQFKAGDQAAQRRIFDFYLAHTAWVNNWDLVDTSAAQIVGAFLDQQSKQQLIQLASSKHLWERRIAIVATLYFIRQQHFTTTFAIARQLLSDKHDLIHKAVGWMLREIGKRDQPSLEKFLEQEYDRLPRTTLRYAIERFAPQRRQAFLKGRR